MHVIFYSACAHDSIISNAVVLMFVLVASSRSVVVCFLLVNSPASEFRRRGTRFRTRRKFEMKSRSAILFYFSRKVASGCKRFYTLDVEECWVVKWRNHSVNYLFAPQRHVVFRGIFVTTAPGDCELPPSHCCWFTPGGSDTVTRWRRSLVGSTSGLGEGKRKMCPYRDSNQYWAAVERTIPTTLSRCTRKNSVGVISVMYFLNFRFVGSVTRALPW